MFNFDYIIKQRTKEHNPKWQEISNHPYQMLIIGGSGSGKTNVLLNLINNEPDIDKIYLYAKDKYGAKYQFLLHKRERTGLKCLNDPKAFTEYSNYLDSIYKNIEEYSSNKKQKILIVRVLSRNLKLMTFSQNWEIRLVFTKSCHHGWWGEFFFFAKTRKTLENAIFGIKYFKVWHHNRGGPRTNMWV